MCCFLVYASECRSEKRPTLFNEIPHLREPLARSMAFLSIQTGGVVQNIEKICLRQIISNFYFQSTLSSQAAHSQAGPGFNLQMLTKYI